MDERQFLRDPSEMEKELRDLVTGYGNEEVNRLYAEQKTAESNKSLPRREQYERLAMNCRALISVVNAIKPKTRLDILDKDSFVLHLQRLEVTALEGINILSRPKISVDVPVKVPVVKVESEQELNVAATFWGAITSIATTLVEAASPPAARKPSPPLTPPTPQVSPREKIVQSASIEILSEEKTLASKEIFTEQTKVTFPQKPKKANKKKKSRLVTIEGHDSPSKIQNDALVAQEQARLAQEKSVKEVEQTKALIENTQAEIKKITEQLAGYQEKPLGEATRQTLRELEHSVNSFLLEIPAEFRDKLASFVESVLLEESLQKYSESIQQLKTAREANVPVREETTDDKFSRIYFDPKKGPENFVRELKENEAFREEMIARPDLMEVAIKYIADDMDVLLDEIEKNPEDQDDLLAGIEELHELALYLQSFLPQEKTVESEFEEEMAPSEVVVKELPIEPNVEANLRDSQKYFKKDLEVQKNYFLNAIDQQLMDRRAVVARETGLNGFDILTLEEAYKNSLGKNNNIAKTAAKKWWDFSAIQAASDFISINIAGIPPYQERVAHLQQQLISAKSAHDLTEVLAQPKTATLEHRITVEFAIGKFDMDKTGKALLKTLDILGTVQKGIADLKKMQPEPTPEKKRGLAGVVDRMAKRQRIDGAQDKPRPK